MYLSYFRKLAITVCLPLLIGVSACEKFEYSPNEVRLDESEQDLTRKNLEKIQALDLDKRTTFRFAVISDTQRFYDELDDAVDALNNRNDLDFVIITGDITDFGQTKEYRWINDRMQKLKIPFLTVIGNHDCVGNGKKIYQAMYGPYDYTMNIGRNRFVFINTNSLEFDEPVPDLDFFRKALQDTANFDQAFVLSHIPPFDADFDKSMEEEFNRISNQSKVKVSIHGHQHGYREPRKYYGDAVDYLIVGSVEKRGYEEIAVTGRQIELKRILF
ncbi:metallophosphoesterase [Adhaeribacter sp. BT258]|uniref:Metallophosphoesterase n=1 Tax=Adhaeribacter terrigena TaxID=2793070 RepID=A0ABS1BZ43_9BACT|nr:metallophosphoesterase [Adhaeribacter terrigena]MBK0402432.1 metallophosphoesterase [Adhaeribacter terrigena]